MITRTYLEKVNTIIEDSELNLGINPVAELCYGVGISRALIYFNHNKIKSLVEDKTYPDISKLKHILKLTNCGSIDATSFSKQLPTYAKGNLKERATSFDLIFFLVPQEWDRGRGFDYNMDFWIGTRSSVSKDGCNWFQPMNGYEWDENGIFSIETLSKEYVKFSEGQESIIIARQHFDYGNENFEIDITETVNKFITNELPNYGIGIAFSPLTESKTTMLQQYIGFFTNHTNTFFEPYLETIYNDVISDDRIEFFLNKPNKLYLYANIGGEPRNLDNIPTCEVNGKLYEVKQATKGIYYVDITINSNEVGEHTMLYDKWSNLSYNGQILDDVEMEFVTLPSQSFFSIGNDIKFTRPLVPSLSGIKSDEKIRMTDKRLIKVDFRIPYTTNQRQLYEKAEYRLYVKDGVRELDVISYQPIEKTTLHNYFYIDTRELLPNEYWIDIRVISGQETYNYKDLLRFKVISDVSEVYH